MTTGRIQSITPDWRGDTLAADVAALDTVLSVQDTADFDELEDDAARWLSIAGDAAVEYVDVDHDANTVTLAAPAGTTYEAGLPVQVWDPTVPNGGAPVVEYLATVMTDRGPVPAVIPHEIIPLAGVDFLTGASVTLDEDDDGDWYIAKVLGREAVIDPDSIDAPYCVGSLTADDSIPNATWTTLTGWFTFKEGFTATVLSPGVFYVQKTGWYSIRIGVRWRSNALGRRACKSIRHTILGTFDQFTDSRPADDSPAMSTLSVDAVFLQAGDSVEFQAYQDSGAALDYIGPETTFSVNRIGGPTL